MATAVGLNMKITADTAGIGRGMTRTEKLLAGVDKNAQSAARSLKGIAAVQIGGAVIKGLQAIVNTLTNAARAAVDFTSRLSDSIDTTAKLAQRTGVGVEALQGFQLAAELSGVQNFEEAISKLGVKLGQAGAGNKDVLETLQKLGLSFEELQRLSPEDRFTAVAKAIQGLPSELERSAAAVKLFEEGGIQLLPLFAQNLEEVQKRAERLGIVLSSSQTSAIEEMNDALTLVRKTFDGIIGQVTANLAPIVTSLAEEFLAFVEAFEGVNGSTGGTAIADALTSGLLDFAQYLAEVFDAVIMSFGDFSGVMSTVAEVFSFVGNVFAGAVDSYRMLFAEFALAGNLFKSAVGAFLEAAGRLTFSEDLRSYGNEMRTSANQAAVQNVRDIVDAGNSAVDRYTRALTGGDLIRGDGEGPLSRAVQAARDRLGNAASRQAERMGAFSGASVNPDESGIGGAEKELQRVAEQAAKAQADAARAAAKAAEQARKAEEKRLDAIRRADEQIAQVESERAKRAAEIEADRLDALSQASNQALSVSDIRSGGISEVMRLAAGREDPALDEYRKQLGELRKIDAKLGELRADRVEIVGNGARA